MIKAFFRNDDVRGELDDSLVCLTEMLISEGLTVSHAVEPANVSLRVVTWLLDIKRAYPENVEIIQHGFDHNIKTKPPYRGEFGGKRKYKEQLLEIEHGRHLMDLYFGDQWTRIFSFPYGLYDLNTLKALEACRYRIITTGTRLTLKRKLFNYFGRLINTKRTFNRNIVYFNEKIPNFNIYEFPVMINNTKIITSNDTGIQLSCKALLRQWTKVSASIMTRGILCHHRYNSIDDIAQLVKFMKVLMSRDVRFYFIGELYEQMDNM